MTTENMDTNTATPATETPAPAPAEPTVVAEPAKAA